MILPKITIAISIYKSLLFVQLLQKKSYTFREGFGFGFVCT